MESVNGPLNVGALAAALGVPASDASAGQRATAQANAVAAQAPFERLDAMLLQRLRNLPTADAAAQVTHASDAAAVAERIAELISRSPGAARDAQGSPRPDHVRHLLGE